MAGEQVQRRLAAILAADVAGYSRLMGADEEGTLAALTAHRAELIEPCIARHRGRLVKTTGDGLLVEFASVVDAVRCAVAVQEGIAARNAEVPEGRRITFRIGVNLGDVIVQDDDVYGDGVNIAARLEGLAAPGGVVVSGMVHEAVRTKLDIPFDDLGAQQVKNIAAPVRAYRVAEPVPDKAGTVDARPALTLPDKPSIAVLPFDNMSGDPDQEYFADGLTEDIITALSRWRSFPVIARNSTFTYKGKAVRVQQIADELGARYVLEGGVRKAGRKVRVTAQLVDAVTGHHVWAQKFDRDLEDIFAVQDEITRHIAVTVAPELERAETRRSAAKHPRNLDAWDCHLRGLAFLYETSKDGNIRAREMFERALGLDPAYGRAFAGISYICSRELLLSYAESFDDTAARCLEAAERAVDLDAADSFTRTILVRALLWSGRHDAALDEAKRALELNPYDSQAYNWLGVALIFAGRPADGIPAVVTGLELAPHDPRNNFIQTELALAYLSIGLPEKALRHARAAAHRRSDFIEADLVLASLLAHSGEKAEARAVLDRVPVAGLGAVERRMFWRFYRDPRPKELVLDGLRRAGLPE